MANFVEPVTPTFDPVPILATADSVLGDNSEPVAGPPNVQALAFLNRSAFLNTNMFNKTDGDEINGGYVALAIDDLFGSGPDPLQASVNGAIIAKFLGAIIDDVDFQGVTLDKSGKVSILRLTTQELEDLIVTDGGQTVETATTKVLLGFQSAFHSGKTGLHISNLVGGDPTKPRIGLVLDGSLDLFKDKDVDVWQMIGGANITGNLTVSGTIINGPLNTTVANKVSKTGDVMTGGLSLNNNALLRLNLDDDALDLSEGSSKSGHQYRGVSRFTERRNDLVLSGVGPIVGALSGLTDAASEGIILKVTTAITGATSLGLNITARTLGLANILLVNNRDYRFTGDGLTIGNYYFIPLSEGIDPNTTNLEIDPVGGAADFATGNLEFIVLEKRLSLQGIDS